MTKILTAFIFALLFVQTLSACLLQSKTSPVASFEQTQYKDLSSKYKKTLKAAAKIMDRSYSPYSHFQVGAAVLTAKGDVIEGTNVENAAYGSTICAERSAIFRANAEGKRDIVAIAIIGRGSDFVSKEVIAPCGACRQVIFEFAQLGGHDIEVIMSNTEMDKIVLAKISELLPLGFGPKDLDL